jgi:hypothetical protein
MRRLATLAALMVLPVVAAAAHPAPEPLPDHPRRKRLGRDGAGPLFAGPGQAWQCPKAAWAQALSFNLERGCAQSSREMKWG